MIKYKRITHKITPLLQILKGHLKNDPEVLFAYCFGSYGKGQPHSLSDVDIAIFLAPEVKSVFEKKLEIQEVLSKILLTDEIDIVILNDAPISLSREVLRSGKLLACRDEQRRIDFEVSILKKYFDTAWLRELAEKNLIKRIMAGQYGYSRIG